MYMIYIHRIYIRTIDYILRCVNLSWFPSLLDIVNPMAPCVAQARNWTLCKVVPSSNMHEVHWFHSALILQDVQQI